MSDFWAKALGTQPAPQQQQTVAAPASQRPWWSGDQPVQAQQVPQQEQAMPGDELAGHDFSKATHLKTQGTCPDCGSGNLAPTGKVTTRNGTVQAERCFDCGWPVQHSTKGMGSMRGEAADGRARQTDTGGAIVHNYQPQNIAAGAIRSAGDLR